MVADTPFVMVWFGLGGHHADMATVHDDSLGFRCTTSGYVSGYDTPETFFKDKDNRARLVLGAPVIDKRAVLERDPGISIRGPLCKVDLEVSEPGTSTLRYVTTADYVEYWRRAGARIGFWSGQEIAWESPS